MLGCVRMLLLQIRSFHGLRGQGGRFVGFNDGLLPCFLFLYLLAVLP